MSVHKKNEFANANIKLANVLGLPNNCTKATIYMDVNKPPLTEATFYVFDLAITKTQLFELNEIKKP